jgi:hypothetical protein
MSPPRDDWDAEERDAMAGLEGELAEIRRRHAGDPSLAMLRAADADALPPDEQARVTRHLQESPWGRVVVEGLRAADADADVHLDAESEQRLFDRITREAHAAAPKPAAAARPRWRPAMIYSSLAAAAVLILAVVVMRPGREDSPTPAGPTPPAVTTTTPVEPVSIAFDKPEVRLSASALTWRGDPSANPFLRDLAPAFDAYRAGDYPRAAAVFDRLATVYPDAIEVRFYQGASRLLAGDAAGAIAPLEAAARLRNATFADDVAWSLAVAQQRAGRSSEARARFADLCRGASPHAAAACAALTALGAPPAPPRGR